MTVEFSDTNIMDLAKCFFKLAEKGKDVFWIRSADFNRQLYISPAFEKIWARKCKDLYENPMTWIQAIFPDDREAVLETFNKTPKPDETYVLNFRITQPDGQIRLIQDDCFPLFNDVGECFGYAGIAKDVTHEKKQLAELEEASRFFRFFAEKIKSVFWVRDPTGQKQLYVSPAYEKIWGRDSKALYENPMAWVETLHEEDREPPSIKSRLELLNEVDPDFCYEYRYRIIRPDGQMAWIKDTSFAIHDEDKFIGFAGIAEDITQSVLYEQELQDAKSRAEIANQTKSNFLAMMSHELRTPLNAILGMTQILRMKDIAPELQECVSVIANAGTSLLALVNDVLDFAKLEVGELKFVSEPIDLQLLISQVIHGLHHQSVEKNIALQLDYPDSVPTLVLSDAKRIRQILVNLIGNALKFTEKGYVKVEALCLTKTKTQVELQIKVIDTGIGIEKDKLELVFEKFSQVDSIYQRKYQGTGLGLAITRELVEKMGGKIGLISEMGKGSEFTFVLPFLLQSCSLEKPCVNYAAKREVNEKPNFGFKVLLVEDNSINQLIAKIMLEEVGCAVTIIDVGQKAIDHLKQYPDYDIVFMDIGLPDISGFDVVTEIRKEVNLRDLPVVAMTAHILERDRQQCFAVGMNGVIAKPISQDDLTDVLAQWVVQ